MWKRMMIALFMLFSAFSVGYAYYNLDLNASSNIYHAGGNVTGRIHQSPSNLSVRNSQMQKGDRVLLDTKNPELNEPITLQLIEQATYTSYNCPTHNNTCVQPTPITSWLSITDKAIGHTTTGLTTSDYISNSDGARYALYTDSKLYQEISAFNQTISSKDQSLFTYQDTGILIPKLIEIGLSSANVKGSLNVLSTSYNKKAFYLGSVKSIELLNKQDLKFTENYWSGSFYHSGGPRTYINYYVQGSTGIYPPGSSSLDKNSGLESDGRQYALRPFVNLDLQDVVFAISQGNSTSCANVSTPNLPSGYTNLHADATGTAMKLRVENPLLTSSTVFNYIQDDSNNRINKIISNETIYLNASAQPGNDGDGGVYTVSALLFNENGEFVYYMPLEDAKGSGLYEFDLTGVSVGKYKIGLVNEVYNENSTAASESSKITDVLPLEIVPPVSITVMPSTGLEYGNNVSNGDSVATYTTSDGVSPITITLVSDTSVSGHENDDQLFSVSNGNIVVNDPNGLDAGDYYFKVNAIDNNGDPTGGVDSNTVHITVAKTNPTIVFNDPNQTKKSINNASTSWSETATATPNISMKISYAKVGGDIGMINIDPDIGAITYNGGNAFGKVKIRATVDDDSSTGKDNYHPAFVEKEIVIYREVDGNITPDPASSDTTIPTFSASDANVRTGGTIGNIQGTLGTPDTIGGSTTTYSYTIKSEPTSDGSLFQVNTSTGIIKANANLGVDTYNFVIIVSDRWSSKEIPVTVNVGMAPAENLKFYQSSTSNTIINTKSAALTDTSVSVFATVKGSANNNPVTYRIQDGSTNVITVHPNSGAVTINGVGTVVIVAEKAGNTGQANAITELTFTVTAGSQSFIYTDASGNELTKSGNSYDDYSEVYGQGKTFQLYTTGNPPGTTVTYALKAGSPTDVISVDPSGLVSIYNASLNTQIGKVIVEATSHDPTGNYTDKTIELPITITKANHTISFKDVTPAQNGKGKVTPVILAQNISSNEGGVIVNDTSYYITIDSSIPTSLAWTSNGIDIEYNYDKEEGIEIPLHVEKAGNRNYNKAEANGKMRILGPDESTLTINRPGKIVYGDHFTLRSLQDDSSSSNVQYIFEVDNTIFVSNPTVNGNMAEFDALKCSSGTKINITVTRTADSEMTLSKKVTIEVLPKDINIIVDDKTKQKGESNPELTFQDFTNQLVSWSGVQDVVDSSIVKLSTTATKDSKAGSYPITGNTKEMNTTYPNYNFIFKEGKLMIDTKIDKDVDGDGKPDYNDPDGDGCPDLNIKWRDDTGNWIVINGDRDYDGIPDLNIDSDGDGKPTLNIDTDHDGKPDINLVILKKTDWKPTKCVVVSSTVKEEYCTGTSIKPQINIDTDNDEIPNINIDTNGDMKADINIDINKDNIADVNLNTIETWKPNKDFKHQNFQYDTMDNIQPYLNIDTNGDNCPDMNLDMDQDGIADLNIDTDDDQIPNVNIDSSGDGKADMNLDTNDDGIPDENIVEITEWKPDKKVDNICTMIIKQNTELEDNGIKVEKPDGTPFLPNFSLKVEDVTDKKQIEISNNAKDFIEEKQEVKKVYDVKLLKDGVEIQPDGILKVKIPYESYKNPILIRRLTDGTYEQIEYKIENGYLIYETDELGIVSIIGDKDFETSVKGTYTPNIGGALTGDETNIYLNLIFIMTGFTVLMILKRNKQKDTFQ